MAEERVSDDFWREVIGASKVPFAIVGVVLIALSVWLLWPEPRDESIDIIAKIEPTPPTELVLDARSAAATDALIAAEKLVVRGRVELPSPRVLIANELVFEPGSVLEMPTGNLTVLAPRVRDATFDVSGKAGPSAAEPGAPGRPGLPGGSVVLAAGEIVGTRLVARGGDGGAGQRGHAGAPGQRGYCGPNGFRIAERGDSGGDGGNGGAAGPGGLIMVLYRYEPPEGEANPGNPGAAGSGGVGGAGGTGCKGVRGTQKEQSPGNDGTKGRAGSKGSAGSVSMRRVAFWDVVRAFTEWRDEDATGDPRKLHDRLRAIATLKE